MLPASQNGSRLLARRLAREAINRPADQKIALLQQAVRLAPQDGEIRLLRVLASQNGGDEVHTGLRQVLACDPTHATAWGTLAVHRQRFDPPETVRGLYHQALAIGPPQAPWLHNLACLNEGSGGNGGRNESGEAGTSRRLWRRALALDPRLGAAWRGLAAHRRTGPPLAAAKTYAMAAVCPDEESRRGDPGAARWAARLYRQGRAMAAAHAVLDAAIGRHPNDAGLRLERGGWRIEGSAHLAGVLDCRKALALRPDQAVLWSTLGAGWSSLDRLDAALGAHEIAERLNGHDATIAFHHGVALYHAGRLRKGEAAFRRALEQDPFHVSAYRNLLTLLHYRDDIAPAAIYAEHRRFNARFSARTGGTETRMSENTGSSAASPAFVRPGDPERPLRIGFLSAEMHATQSVARNVLPLLRAHDRRQVVPHLFLLDRLPDAATTEAQALVAGWERVTGLEDAAIAARIRAAAIDILVLLGGHFDSNRPLVAVHRAAPVQISFHDIGSSGLDAMDYLIADPVLAPRRRRDDNLDAGEGFSERPLRLPSFYLIDPPQPAPTIGPPPSQNRGQVTYGCFGNPAKIGDRVLHLWGRLLNRNPTARLMLKYRGVYAAGPLVSRVTKILVENGAKPEQIAFLPKQESLKAHLEWYNHIDVALDPFPFCGSTTTFEALFMGVPTVTLPRGTMVSRWTASILRSLGRNTLGLREALVARDEADYLLRAERVAADEGQRGRWRQGLRAEILASPMCDARLKARHMERLYRAVWRRWCIDREASGRGP